MTKRNRDDINDIDDDISSPSLKKQKLNPDIKFETIQYDIEWYGGSDKGKKAHMEDRRIAINDLSAKFNHPYLKQNTCRLFSIIDGHGGSSVATYIQNNLASIFVDNLKKYVINNNNNNKMNETLNIQKALHATFKNCDSKILSWINPMKSEGATCTLVYFHNNMVFTACIGDSKCVLCRISLNNNNNDNNDIDMNLDNKLESLLITRDHTVLQLSEVKRIESSGGNIINGRVNGILQVTRCFGDPSLKKIGVTSIPNISKFNICCRDEFMIIGCDGLWSVFSVSDAIQFVYKKFNHVSKPTIQEVTRQLLAEAILNKQAKDNVSGIVIRFKHH